MGWTKRRPGKKKGGKVKIITKSEVTKINDGLRKKKKKKGEKCGHSSLNCGINRALLTLTSSLILVKEKKNQGQITLYEGFWGWGENELL